jgi:hypothetical protein
MGKDEISGLYMQRYPSQTIWSLAIFVSFDGLRQGFRSVFGSTAVYICIYSNGKPIACERFERFRKSRNGRRSQNNFYRCPKLETRTLIFPCIHYISNAHMSVRPHVHKYSKRCTHTHFLVATPSMHGFFHALSFELSFSPLPAHLLPHASMCHACYRSFSCSFSHCSGV